MSAFQVPLITVRGTALCANSNRAVFVLPRGENGGPTHVIGAGTGSKPLQLLLQNSKRSPKGAVP